MPLGSAGRAPSLVGTHVVALYRPTDARVVHLHTVRIFEGGRAVEREEAERDAFARAERIGHDIHSLRALHLPEPPNEPGPYRADVDGRRLIAESPHHRGRP